MRDYIALCESSNYAMKLSYLLSKEKYYGEVVSTPFRLASEGCGYSVRFAESIYEKVREIARNNSIKIKAVYEIEPQMLKNNYILLEGNMI